MLQFYLLLIAGRIYCLALLTGPGNADHKTAVSIHTRFAIPSGVDGALTIQLATIKARNRGLIVDGRVFTMQVGDSLSD